MHRLTHKMLSRFYCLFPSRSVRHAFLGYACSKLIQRRPIMAAFAIEAVSQIMTRASTWRLEKRRVDEGVEEAATEATKRAISHAEYVLKQRQRWDSHKKGQDTQAQRSSRSTVTGSEKGEVKEKVRAADAKEARLDEEEQEVQVSEQLNAKVMKELVQHAVALELHARRLLLQHLPAGSQAEILLKADRNVQLRDLRALLRGIGANEEADDLDAGTTGNGGDLSEKERTEKRKKAVERLGLGDAAAQDADWVSPPMSDEEVMEELRQYRESFAGLLVAGSGESPWLPNVPVLSISCCLLSSVTATRRQRDVDARTTERGA